MSNLSPEDRAPSRDEARREEYEEHMIDTFEDRYLEWCAVNEKDPETVGSVIEFDREEYP